MDGEVLSLGLAEGRPVQAFTMVGIVADPRALEIHADLGPTQLEELTEGMPVAARLTSRPGEEMPGQIRELPYPYGGGGRSAGATDDDSSTRVMLDESLAELGLAQ